MPKVSVVIPAFNAQSSIGRALDSVQNQNFHDYEVILIDDRSTDGTVAHAARHVLAASGKMQIFYQQQNKGAAAARNMGWLQATGEFIAFLDADDAWHDDKLRLQIPLMEAGADISGHRTPILRSSEQLQAKLDYPLNSVGLRRRDVLLKNPFHTSSVIVRRDLPQRFSEELSRAEDYLLWCDIILSGHRGLRVYPPLAFVFKSFYGGAGLSANLQETQKGELAVYSRLLQRGFVRPSAYFGLRLWSYLRHWRRLLRVGFLR